MARDEIHVGDVGTQFLITMQDGDNLINLSTATTITVLFHKPDGNLVVKTGTLYTDGSDGIISYITTTTSDLDLEGLWKVQVYLIFASGSKFHSDYANFPVFPNLD